MPVKYSQFIHLGHTCRRTLQLDGSLLKTAGRLKSRNGGRVGRSVGGIGDCPNHEENLDSKNRLPFRSWLFQSKEGGWKSTRKE
jgi:hypothetical protein